MKKKSPFDASESPQAVSLLLLSCGVIVLILFLLWEGPNPVSNVGEVINAADARSKTELAQQLEEEKAEEEKYKAYREIMPKIRKQIAKAASKGEHCTDFIFKPPSDSTGCHLLVAEQLREDGFKADFGGVHNTLRGYETSTIPNLHIDWK